MTDLQNLSDAELMQLARNGDEEAFVAIYRKNSPGLYRFALHMSGSRSVAEDVAQEVFLTLLRKSSDYDAARGTLASYLFGIARKHLLKHYDRVKLQVSADSGAHENAGATPEPLIERTDPLSRLSTAEADEAVRHAILSLPPRYREALVLCELEEMSYEEAGALAGCSVGTIRSRLHRGRSLLAMKLRPAFPAKPASVRNKRCLA